MPNTSSYPGCITLARPNSTSFSRDKRVLPACSCLQPRTQLDSSLYNESGQIGKPAHAVRTHYPYA
jgi:hypothetical protein